VVTYLENKEVSHAGVHRLGGWRDFYAGQDSACLDGVHMLRRSVGEFLMPDWSSPVHLESHAVLYRRVREYLMPDRTFPVPMKGVHRKVQEFLMITRTYVVPNIEETKSLCELDYSGF